MENWSYSDYKQSISDSIEQAVKELGFSIEQAIGYAESDLDFRLSEKPNETALAMIALGKVIIDNSMSRHLLNYPFFIEELKQITSSLDAINFPALDEKDLKTFNQDKEIVSKFISNMDVID